VVSNCVGSMNKKDEAYTQAPSTVSKADGAAGVGLGISGATDSKSDDRRLPKTDPTVPGHRVTIVMLSLDFALGVDVTTYY